MADFPRQVDEIKTEWLGLAETAQKQWLILVKNRKEKLTLDGF